MTLWPLRIWPLTRETLRGLFPSSFPPLPSIVVNELMEARYHTNMCPHCRTDRNPVVHVEAQQGTVSVVQCRRCDKYRAHQTSAAT